MIFNRHYGLEGRHAWLSASKYSWINYDEAKLRQTFANDLRKALGVELHEFASFAIRLKQRQPKSGRTLNNYINDAIGFRMNPEVVLRYSDDIFGTADAIGFRDGILRIFDLKTGQIPAKFAQLEIYAALFCLEYDENPESITIELRIYQDNGIEIFNPEAENIRAIMDKIKFFDPIIQEMRAEQVMA